MSYSAYYFFEPGDDGKGRVEDGDQLATGTGWLNWGGYVLDRDEEFPGCAHLADEGGWWPDEDAWEDLEHEVEQLTHADDPNVAAVSARLLAAIKARPEGAAGIMVGDGTEPDPDGQDDDDEE